MLGDLEGERQVVVADLEAGVGTLQRMRPGQADLALIVAQPTAKSVEAARRGLELAAGKAEVVVVANRVTSDDDVRMIREGLGDPPRLVVVPDDEAVARADEEGLAPFDAARGSAAVRAVEAIVDDLLAPAPL